MNKNKRIYLLFVCILLVVFSAFAFAGCGGDDDKIFSDNIHLCFILEENGETIITKDNITSITITPQSDSDFYQINFFLDEDGTASFSTATAPVNQGKSIISVVTYDNCNYTISSASINSQISNGKASLNGSYSQSEAQSLVDQLTGKSFDDMKEFLEKYSS